MFRKSTLALAACVLTLATVSTASAQFPFRQQFPQQPVQFPQQFFPQQRVQFAPQQLVPVPQQLPIRHEEHYHVMYKTCITAPWQLYRTVDCHEYAHELENRLARRGLITKVVHH